MADIIAQDIISKINNNYGEGRNNPEYIKSEEEQEEDRGNSNNRKSRPKSKSSSGRGGNNRRERKSVWPISGR